MIILQGSLEVIILNNLKKMVKNIIGVLSLRQKLMRESVELKSVEGLGKH